MLIRFLLLLFFVWVVAKVLRGLSEPLLRQPSPGPYSPRPGRSPARVSGGELVQDPQCGVYVPRETALTAGGRYFCSEACREAFSTKRESR